MPLGDFNFFSGEGGLTPLVPRYVDPFFGGLNQYQLGA
jgi:hypothetical protein